MKACASSTNVCLCYIGNICITICLDKHRTHFYFCLSREPVFLIVAEMAGGSNEASLHHHNTPYALTHPSWTKSVSLQLAGCPGPGFLPFIFDICQCSEIYFKHQLTLSGFPGGIFTHKIGGLAHHPWMSGANQSSGTRSVRNNNRRWDGIQSASVLMILTQPATSDKARVVSTVPTPPTPQHGLLITTTQIKLIPLRWFNVNVILIMLFPSKLSSFSQWVWSSPCKVIAPQFIAQGTLWNADLIKNKCTNFILSSRV